ncbi:expression site-associated gene (ESAG) protein, putative, partial [Trypanosoma vivax Y486]
MTMKGTAFRCLRFISPGTQRRKLCIWAALIALFVPFLVVQHLVFPKAALPTGFDNPVRGNLWPPCTACGPRVVFVSAQTKASPGWCRMMISAILSNISVVTIGEGATYSHASRPAWILDYINDAGLRDEDVVVAFDGSDTFFTAAANAKKAVEDFLSQTAADPGTFNSMAARSGPQRAPLQFESQVWCFAPQLKLMLDSGPSEKFAKCKWHYANALAQANAVDPNQRLMRPPESGFAYLSGGAMVGRVWAIREAFRAYAMILQKSRWWWCDQSIWTLLYLWSASPYSTVEVGFRPRHGLISLDFDNIFSMFPRFGLKGSPALIHLPGHAKSWKQQIPGFLAGTAWYPLLQSSPAFRKDARKMIEAAVIEVYNSRGQRSMRRFS